MFFKLINRTTELAGLEQLRRTNPGGDDLEVRIWRGFGLGNLEAVILKRDRNKWQALHVKADDYFEPQQAEVKKLGVPKQGWEPFWNDLTKKGILTLRDPSELNCEDLLIDGSGYVVEINQNKIYRTYQMQVGGKCPGVRQMEEIGDLIGEAFDSGSEECRTTEWFACARVNRSKR